MRKIRKTLAAALSAVMMLSSFGSLALAQDGADFAITNEQFDDAALAVSDELYAPDEAAVLDELSAGDVIPAADAASAVTADELSESILDGLIEAEEPSDDGAVLLDETAAEGVSGEDADASSSDAAAQTDDAADQPADADAQAADSEFVTDGEEETAALDEGEVLDELFEETTDEGLIDVNEDDALLLEAEDPETDGAGSAVDASAYEIISSSGYELNEYYADMIPAEDTLAALETIAAEDGEGQVYVTPDDAEKQQDLLETQQEIAQILDASQAAQTQADAEAGDAAEELLVAGEGDEEAVNVSGETEIAETFSDAVEFLQAGASAGYLKSEAKLASLLRSRMKARTRTFTFYYQTTNAYNKINDIISRSIKKAYAHTGNEIEGDYIYWQYGGSKWNYSIVKSFNKVKVTMNVNYYTTAAQESTMNSAVATALRSAWDSCGINENSTDYQKIEAIYRYICRTIRYDYDHLHDSSYKLQYTAYAGLINKTCVCQGYAVLLYRMMLARGYDCRVVTSIPHAWNIVKLNGKYYNVDATWDEASYASPGTYDWFLKNMNDFIDWNGLRSLSKVDNHLRESNPGNGENFASSAFSSKYPMSATSYSATTCDNASGGHQYAWTKTDNPTVFRGEQYRGVCSVCSNVAYKSVGNKLTAVLKLNTGSPLKMRRGQKCKKIKVTMARGDSVSSWKSSNKKIVAVSNKGVLTAKKVGTAKITVTLKSGKKKTFKVKVQYGTVATTKINNVPKRIEIAKGKTYKLSPRLSPITSQQKITYSTSNRKKVTVTSKGKIKGVRRGRAYVTVRSGSKRVKVLVIVK